MLLHKIVSGGQTGADSVAIIPGFLESHRIRTLNVAGPRASTDPGIYPYVVGVLKSLGA